MMAQGAATDGVGSRAGGGAPEVSSGGPRLAHLALAMNPRFAVCLCCLLLATGVAARSAPAPPPPHPSPPAPPPSARPPRPAPPATANPYFAFQARLSGTDVLVPVPSPPPAPS